MKKLSLVSAIIVFVFSLCYPMGPIAHCSSAGQHGDLACFCCSGIDRTCAMYLCTKCSHGAGSEHHDWLYDTLLSDFTFSAFFQPLQLMAERIISLKTVDREVPYKPPKS
jgi:hypothetical protein